VTSSVETMNLNMRCLVLFLLIVIVRGEEKFIEELYIRQTPSGHVYNHFQFTTRSAFDIREKTREHYDLFARSIGDIIAAYSVQELDLSLTQGLWRYEKWGYPIQSFPPGAQVVARFHELVPDVDKAWEGLTSALAGLLCASLNNLDKTKAIQPEFSFPNQGIVGNDMGTNRTYLRYGTLPRENLCTENLTPWKKLLPCKNKRGLAVLLSSAHIQKYSVYLAINLNVKPVCMTAHCDQPGVELVQSVDTVMDPVIMNKQTDNIDWNIKTMFGIGITPGCALASISSVFVDMTDATYTLQPQPTNYIYHGAGKPRKIAVYNIKTFTEHGISDIMARHTKPHIYGIVRSPPVLVSRHVVGTGQERGGIVATIKNSCNTDITATYLEIIPWYLRVYLHTLNIQTDGGATLIPIKTVYRPGRDRDRPYHVEIVLKLPPRSTTVIRLDTEYSILRWTEYPPDANHGLYVGSAVLSLRLPADNVANATVRAREDSTLSYLFLGNIIADPVIQLYTETLLITVPTPDFSMPYNVICLACTIAALAFGPIHNITTKQLVLVSPEEEEKSLLSKLVMTLIGLLPFRSKKKENSKINEDNAVTSSEAEDTDQDQNSDSNQ